jgi:hypothetical protein
LDISCENEGCTAIIKLDLLENHLMDCEYSPKQLIPCENGCGMSIAQEDLPVRFSPKNKSEFFLNLFLES